MKIYEVQLRSVWEVEADSHDEAIRIANDIVFDMLADGGNLEGTSTLVSDDNVPTYTQLTLPGV